MADKVMYNAVKSELLGSFMKKKDGDVYLKAAQMEAINLLEDGFKNLKRFSNKEQEEVKELKQVGL